MAQLSTILHDWDPTYPHEVEGSPTISTDEVTRGKTITRTFAVLKANYNPLVQGSRDVQFPQAVLINENPGQINGPILWFTRTYVEIPAGRSEARTVSFTSPGFSQTQFSSLSSLAIGWNQYGAGSPFTNYKPAVAQISYALQLSLTQDPNTLFIIPALSRVTYNGAPVDYVGQVWGPVGQISIPQGTFLHPLPPIIEQRFDLLGFTAGFISGSDWIYSTNVTRFRGPIWELEVVKIPALFL